MRSSSTISTSLVALLLSGVLGSPASAQRQISTDSYTRYELLEPGSGAFRIVYDVTAEATAAGSRFYFNSIRSGAEEEVHGVTDLHTGLPLQWEVVEGSQARALGLAAAGDEDRYIRVSLPATIPPGGEARLRIDKTYIDTASYAADGAEIVFDRTLGIPRNAIVLPAGYELVAVNVPSQVAVEGDGRIRVSFMNATGATLRTVVRARPLPANGAAALLASATTDRATAGPPTMTGGGTGFDGSLARTGRTFGQRAAETREIVYYLEHPASSSFRLHHDYTEERPGTDRYLNVVRAGSSVSDARAFLIDTGEELAVETVTDTMQVVLIRYPAVADGSSARIRIHETYTDPARYTLAGEELVWDRALGRARNQVILPQGWFLTANDMPAVVDALPDGRVRLTYWNDRPSNLQVFLRALRRDPPVAVSLFGEELHARPHPDPLALSRADEALATRPDDLGALIAAGRERRSAFRYVEAIDLYTRAMGVDLGRWEPYRFRGHRYLSTRRFAEGAADLSRARELAPFNFDVAYHLGLAYYLLGRFDEAADEYLRCLALADHSSAQAFEDRPDVEGQRTCMTIATDDDARVAITEWAYRALRRAGRDDEARGLLGAITEQMDVIANAAYLEALLFHKGSPVAVPLDLPFPPEGRFETRAYGLALDELLDGDRERALLLLRRVATDPHWPGFGRLAAEADLARLAGG